MKKTIAIAFAITLMLGAVSSVFAQGAGPKNGGQGAPNQRQGQQQGGQRGGMGRRMQQEIFAKLNLSEKQKTQIKAINDKYQKQFEAFRPKNATPGQRPQISDENRKKMMDLFKKRNDEIMAILTPEQKAKYEKLMKEMRSNMQNGRGGQGGPGGPPPTGGKPPKGGSTGGGL